MSICMNESVVYQALKEKSGTPDFLLKTICSLFLEEHGRYPNLDELPKSDSTKYIKDKLKLKKNDSTKIENILKATNSKTLLDSIIELNTEYKDKEINILPIVNEAFVEIKDRPTTGIPNIKEKYVPDENISGPIVLGTAIDKLIDLYGIKVNEITDLELASEQWQDIIPRDRLVNAFIYNGEIYINVDKASPDARIHEMLHLLVGSMRFLNPNLYQELINSAESLPNYNYLINDFVNKSRNDANEEVFILELAKYLSGMDSDLQGLDEHTLYEINYNVGRVLDSILMGDISARTLTPEVLYNMSLKELVEYTNSDIMTNKFEGFINTSELHRKLNNMKSDLLKNKMLEEICD